MAMNVARKTAIITGAGSGINLCFAQLLLEKGCNVVIADLQLRPEAQAVVAQYAHDSAGAKAVFQKTDVADWAQLDKMFEWQIRILAGQILCVQELEYMSRLGPVSESTWHTSLKRDDPSTSRYALLDINLTHPIRVTQMATSHFLARKKPGCIPHISSVAGQVPLFANPMYVATKHALNGFVRSLAPLESPPAPLPKIRVNAVSPALILTPLWTDHPEKMKMVGDNNPGWVLPIDVAKVMLELVEKEEHVGGTILEVGKTVRKVEAFNDGGPAAGGNNVVSEKAVSDPAWDSLMRQMGR